MNKVENLLVRLLKFSVIRKCKRALLRIWTRKSDQILVRTLYQKYAVERFRFLLITKTPSKPYYLPKKAKLTVLVDLSVSAAKLCETPTSEIPSTSTIWSAIWIPTFSAAWPGKTFFGVQNLKKTKSAPKWLYEKIWTVPFWHKYRVFQHQNRHRYPYQ